MSYFDDEPEGKVGMTYRFYVSAEVERLLNAAVALTDSEKADLIGEAVDAFEPQIRKRIMSALMAGQRGEAQ